MQIRKQFNINDFWCGRISKHTAESVREEKAANGNATHGTSLNPVHLVRSVSRRLSAQFGSDGKNLVPERRATVDLSEEERAVHIMNTDPSNLYERMRRGLLEYVGCCGGIFADVVALGGVWLINLLLTTHAADASERARVHRGMP